ncbi:MAG TPA: site-2 protease family protein [Candidatus Limnocylindrales bacterium]|nr:site-2 protease family protein [Candidatus Limnocylindrales bacterium]
MSLDQLMPPLTAVAIMLLVGFPVHEYSHALAAYRQGDRTAQYMGRLTLDPRVHFDPLGGFMLVASALLGGFFIGWAKPTPYNPVNLSGGRRGEAVVAAAGPASNLVMAILGAICVRIILAIPALLPALTTPAGSFILNVLFYFVLINVFLFVFNLLPLPVIGLDGWKVLLGLVSPMTAYRLRQLEMQYQQFILIGLFALIFFGGYVISPISDAILNILLG